MYQLKQFKKYVDVAADKITTLGGNVVIKGDLNTKSAGALK